MLVFLASNIYAQFSQGPYTASNFRVENISGSAQTWRNGTNALSSDNVWSETADSLLQGEFTDYLVAEDFGFSIPSNAHIFGIEVHLECHRSSGNIQNYRSRLVKSGTIGTHDEIASGLWPRPNDKTYTHGSSSALWGDSWTYTDINDSQFGYAMAIDMTSNDGKNHSAKVDEISITVYYDIPLNPPIHTPLLTWSKEGIRIQWNGVKLLPNSTITIERAVKGTSFERLYTLPTLTDSLDWSQYVYVDSLLNGENPHHLIYRIVYSPQESDRYLSHTASIGQQTMLKPSLHCSTSQTGQEITLHYSSIQSPYPVHLSILNAKGQQISKQQLSATWGSQKVALSTQSWSSGVYYLQLAQENQVANAKVIIR